MREYCVIPLVTQHQARGKKLFNIRLAFLTEETNSPEKKRKKKSPRVQVRDSDLAICDIGRIFYAG